MVKAYKLMITLALLSLAFTYQSDAAKRRVIIEDHTGAWCGWCPTGSQTLKDLVDEYGDMVIPVQIHNNDGMSAPTENYQRELAQALGLSGYPGGSTNRIRWNIQGETQIMTHPAYWPSFTDSLLDDTNPLSEVPILVEIADWSINGTTLVATIRATVEKDYDNAQLRFNLIILEDGVTGSGSGWDQENYLSNREGYEDHPYYSKPNPVTNYIHDNVARYYVGGSWGVNGDFPAAVKAGDVYEHTFTQDISQFVSNPNNVWIAGMVQEYAVEGNSLTNVTVMNATSAGKVVLGNYGVEVSTSNEIYNSNDAGETIVQTVEVSNPNDVAVTVDIMMNDDSSMPNGWTVESAMESVEVGPGETKNVDVSLITNDNKGFASVSLDFTVRTVDGEYRGQTSTHEFYSLANGTSNVFINVGRSIDRVEDVISTNPELASSYAIINPNSEVLAAYPLSIFDVGFFLEDIAGAGILGGTPEYAAALKEMLDAGKPVMITSIYSTFQGTNNAANSTPEFIQVLNGLGISTSQLGLVTRLNGTQISEIPPFTISGVANDEVTNGMSITANSNTNYTPFVEPYTISGSRVSPIFTYPNVSVGSIDGAGPLTEGQVAGVKGMYNDTRVILLGFGLDIITNPAERGELLSKAYNWLTSGEAAAPQIDVVSSIDFGESFERTSQIFQINNTGNANLVVTDLQIVDDAEGMFEATANKSFTVVPGATQNTAVFFNPNPEKIGEFTAKLRIISQDNPNGTDVALTATSIVASVNDNKIAGLFEMKAQPNTFANSSILNVDVVGSENVEINMINTNGSVVSTIFNGTIAGTGNSYSIDAANLTSGQYYIVARIDGKVAKLPIIVNK